MFDEPVVVRKVPSGARWGPNEKLEAKHNCLIRLTEPPLESRPFISFIVRVV